MIIGIDAKALAKRETGIAIYIKAMINFFLNLDNTNEYVLFSGLDFEMDPSWKRCKKIIYKVHTTGSLKIAYGLNSLIEKNGVDVFWGPEHCIPLRHGNFKKVVTLHDIAVILHPEWGTYYNAILQKILVKKSLEKADRVVAISNNTKNDLIKKFKLTDNRIQVIYNGDSPYRYKLRNFSSDFEKNIREKFNIYGMYFLFCGTIEPRKNIINIVKGYELFIKNCRCPKDYNLVIAGGLGWKYRPILEYIEKSFVRDQIVMTGYVSDEEKEYLYRNACALVFPSYYEGFGFPIVEAMSVGTPVITANNSSLTEVGGDIAYYVNDADNFVQISQYMNEIAETEIFKNEDVRCKFIEQSLKFNRMDCAKQLLECFKECYAE